MVPLNTVVQDGDDHVSTGVASLPGCKDIHFWTAAAVFITTVLENSESHQYEHAFTCNRFQSHAFDFENREHWKTIDLKRYSQLSRNTSLYYLSNLIMTQSVCEEICHNKRAWTCKLNEKIHVYSAAEVRVSLRISFMILFNAVFEDMINWDVPVWSQLQRTDWKQSLIPLCRNINHTSANTHRICFNSVWKHQLEWINH